MSSRTLNDGKGARRRRRRWRVAGPAALVAAALAAPVAAQDAAAATFTVTTDADAGAGSLREAIDDANTTAGQDRIEFAIQGAGRHQIAPATDLPAITERVVIDGFTQGGTPPAAGAPAELRVVIDAAATTRGLELDTDDAKVRGLAIRDAGATSGQPADAIRISGDRNKVQATFLGLRATGVAAGSASNGVEIAGDENVIGGARPEDRNVISANASAGIAVAGDRNRVEGNTIGTDPAGAVDLGNEEGVWIAGADNVVGGSSLDGTGNLISGNEIGVEVALGTGTIVRGNLVGTDASGDQGLVPGFFTGETGVLVASGASEATVGGSAAGEGNVLGGHADEDVLLAGDANVVQGNHVGTNAAGDAAIESSNGVYVTGDRNLVGGTLAGEGNVISGHRSEGVNFRADPATNSPARRNRIEGNLIGTDASGTVALPNGGDGVELIDANENVIGGTAAGAGNVISGNEDVGVRVRVDDTAAGDLNDVAGNWIGTTASGAPLGNGSDGVRVEEGDGNRIGAANPAVAQNTIAHNGGDGVEVQDDAQDTAVVRNAIFANGELGIDLAPDGPTLNDPPAQLDADAGANGLQNHPVLSLATSGAGGTTVDWELDTTAFTPVRVEFYANGACSAADPAEGEAFLGSVSVITDALGHAAGSTLVGATSAGQQVTATATVDVAPRLDATSEFSPCEEVT